ncbi:XRE family transcriptional regulator [Brevibacillus ruminantium]|uniref:XRE family transcriptional regulator n=1 Tax=Brevibacillus ruminantium TaxID=2950604 RepID=A0ABY4WHJ3_9BACL|nr:XRE family transcriptional regulator [Brevibacillus ruminantium]USG66621.1 XRE family transcriptional regulator [Brevibacillus ruminantium]
MFVIDLSEIGKRIRRARLSQGFTQQELADRCGFTKSLLSKIENGQTASAVATLSKIAEHLKTPLAWFLEENRDEHLVLLPSKQRTSKIGSKEMGYLYETLANRSRFSKIEPVLVTVPPDISMTEPFTHPEEEFIYIVSGTIVLFYDGERYLLEEGDTAYFSGDKPHIFLPHGDKEAKVLSVFIQPSPTH